MTLRIVKAADPITVERVNMCIYAPPGLGKTTLGFSAEEPLNFDFDKGAHRAANRKDIVPVTSWADVADVKAEDLVAYKTIVVDTAGRVVDSPQVGVGSHIAWVGLLPLLVNSCRSLQFTSSVQEIGRIDIEPLPLADPVPEFISPAAIFSRQTTCTKIAV